MQKTQIVRVALRNAARRSHHHQVLLQRRHGDREHEPTKRQPPHDVQSLAHVLRLELVVAEMSAQLDRLGITKAQIEKDWRDKLKMAGIIVAKGTLLPKLKLRIEFMEDPNVPKAAGIICFLTLVQDVRIERLDRVLTLPSYPQYTVGIDAKTNLRKSFGPAVLDMADGFIRNVEIATAHYR